MKLVSIIKTIVYCGTQDIALRGKHSDEGNFHDLLDFRMDAGDTILIDHILKYALQKLNTHHVEYKMN